VVLENQIQDGYPLKGAGADVSVMALQPTK
jgi:hypothetical protein